VLFATVPAVVAVLNARTLTRQRRKLLNGGQKRGGYAATPHSVWRTEIGKQHKPILGSAPDCGVVYCSRINKMLRMIWKRRDCHFMLLLVILDAWELDAADNV
jgi:hypothetical protein